MADPKRAIGLGLASVCNQGGSPSRAGAAHCAPSTLQRNAFAKYDQAMNESLSFMRCMRKFKHTPETLRAEVTGEFKRAEQMPPSLPSQGA
ncbi:MAG: hypothetical protein KJZ83_10615 [Burkholderiaceae bacterium]|nr:hypothetical protein [Burkholderiaceae bacterium]